MPSSARSKRPSTSRSVRAVRYAITDVLPGSVSRDSYRAYFRALGPLTCALVFALALVAQLVEISTSLWFARWTREPRSPHDSLAFYFPIFAALGIATVTLSAIKSFTVLSRGVVAGSRLFARLLDALLGATIQFYSTTPSGRILNRVAEIGQIDEGACWTVRSLGFFAARLQPCCDKSKTQDLADCAQKCRNTSARHSRSASPSSRSSLPSRSSCPASSFRVRPLRPRFRADEFKA